MGGHGPASDWGDDKASDYKSSLGIKMFVFYCFFYVVYVIINVFSPKTMGVEVFAGLNLAVVYGFGLIILAAIMGTIYNSMCTSAEDTLNAPTEEG